MKILHCVYGMNRGGLETFIMNLFRNIDRNKIGFDFLVHTDQECAYDREIKELGGKIYFVPPRKQGVNANRLALRDFFECHPEYQIVHQHVSSLSYIEPLKVAKEKGIPVRIVHGHSTGQGGNYLHRFAHVWNRLHIRNFATHFFACSDLAANWMFGKRYHASGDVQIINNGIPVESFTFDERKRVRKRKELGIEGKFVVGHIGRFAEVKNHDFLVEIFRAVHRLDSNSVLLLVGDGDLRIKTEEKVRLLGLSNNVIFTGLRSDIPELLCAMDVFVLPSLYEGLPVTLVEAQTSGLYCFASDTITRQVAITDLLTYISLDASPMYWAKRIVEDSRGTKRRNMLNCVQDRGFDIALIAENLIRFYSDLVKGDCREKLPN